MEPVTYTQWFMYYINYMEALVYKSSYFKRECLSFFNGVTHIHCLGTNAGNHWTKLGTGHRGVV